MRGTIPKNGVIEFLGYVKNKINGKNLIIFQRPPKLISVPSYQIGDPIEFEKRFENDDFIKKIDDLNKIDIKIPMKKFNVQPMDEFDADFESLEAKMNNKDRKMLNNPEEGLNPFKFKKHTEEGIS